MLSYANQKFTSKPKLSQQDVVKLFCKCDSLRKVAVKKINGVVKEKEHLIHKCPKGDEHKKDGEMRLQKNYGYANGYNHLKSCLCDGDGVELMKLHHKNLEEKTMHIGGFFKPILPISHK